LRKFQFIGLMKLAGLTTRAPLCGAKRLLLEEKLAKIFDF
jgi:hypothetical protein